MKALLREVLKGNREADDSHYMCSLIEISLLITGRNIHRMTVIYTCTLKDIELTVNS